MSKQKITITKYGVNRRIIGTITWLHPNDIDKSQITEVIHETVHISMGELEFLLFRNLMLEAGFVPTKTDVQTYDLPPVKCNTFTYTPPKNSYKDWAKALETNKKIRVQ